MTKQDFIDKLLRAGWNCSGDAQWHNINALLDTIPHFANEPVESQEDSSRGSIVIDKVVSEDTDE